MNLILCGFQGVGKTTIGRLFSKRAAAPFIDTDALILELSGASCCQKLVADKGMSYFRALERQVVRALAGRGMVIALGGGALEDEGNCRILRSLGVLVYLEAPYATLFRRTHLDLEQFYAQRRMHFEALGDYTVATEGKTFSEITLELEKIWEATVLVHSLKS